MRLRVGLAVWVVVTGWGAGLAGRETCGSSSGRAEGVTLVGAVRRWDEDGKARFAVDPKARIDEPRVDARAVHARGRTVGFPGPATRAGTTSSSWPGRGCRVEGFRYPADQRV